MARVHFPAYHSKDLTVMTVSMFTITVIINRLLFDDYFQSINTFTTTTLVSFGFFCFGFITYGWVALGLRQRFADNKDFLKRLLICLSIFYLMSAVYMSVLLLGYDALHFRGYQYSNHDFTRAWITLAIFNTFLTFLNEGIYSYEKFRTTVSETEQLKKEYLRSQVFGLKSQMNPHFLFNSLNILSSLIHEDEEKAEEFLDHMSKVYRYLLRDDEQLVSLETELDFIHSYFLLLQSRLGEGLQLVITNHHIDANMQIPPLTLQMIVEEIICTNTVDRACPLIVKIEANEGWLEVRNNVQPKVNACEENVDIWVNIANKCRLITQHEMTVSHRGNERIVRLPLVSNPLLVTA